MASRLTKRHSTIRYGTTDDSIVTAMFLRITTAALKATLKLRDCCLPLNTHQHPYPKLPCHTFQNDISITLHVTKPSYCPLRLTEANTLRFRHSFSNDIGVEELAFDLNVPYIFCADRNIVVKRTYSQSDSNIDPQLSLTYQGSRARYVNDMAFPPLSAYYSPLDNGNLPAPQPLHPPGLGRAPRLAEAPQPQSLAQQHVSQGQMVAVAAQSVVPAYTPHAPPVQTMNALQNQTASITPAQTTSTPLPPKSGHFAPTPTLTDADVAVLANYTPSVKWTVDGHNPANPTIEYATDLANERRRTAYWVTEMQHAMVDLRNYTDEPSSDGVKMFTNGTVNSQDVPPDHVKLMAYKLVVGHCSHSQFIQN